MHIMYHTKDRLGGNLNRLKPSSGRQNTKLYYKSPILVLIIYNLTDILYPLDVKKYNLL